MTWFFEKKIEKNYYLFFIIFIRLASQFKSQYTVWTECSPQNDMIFWKKIIIYFYYFYLFSQSI